MRIRTVKPEFWTDEDLAEVSEPALILALALINYADDEGYFRANPKLIEGALFPIRNLSVSIHGALTELSNAGFLCTGIGSDGKQYGYLRNFRKHQRIQRPTSSKIKHLCTFTEDSANPHGAFTEASPPEQGTGNREQGIPPTPCEGDGPAFEEEETAGDEPEEKLILSEQDSAPQNQNPAAPPGAPDLAKIRRAGRAEKKRKRVELVTPRMARIGGMVPGRSADRRWTWQEYEALCDIEPVEEADLAVVEAYYAAEHSREEDYRRRQLITLLNNWEAEVVKATRWRRENKAPDQPPGIHILNP